jgi:acetyltransferase-like isoleucine patch superfamily enzyme
MKKFWTACRKFFGHGLSMALIIVPSRIKIPMYRLLFGYRIGRRVTIGLSWIEVGHLEIGDDAHIGHFNRLKNIPHVTIGDHTSIGTGNTFTAADEFTNAQGIAARGNKPALEIGRHCGITIGHYFDVQDSVQIGAFTVIAGLSSVFFTHYLDVLTSAQSTKPISIGRYCMIGSNAHFVPGSGLADYCVVGMGSVVTKMAADPYTQYAGNPAAAVRALPHDAAYFLRSSGWIGTYSPRPFTLD